MNPFLDEKLILTVSASFYEVLSGRLEIHAEREAFGATRVEGLCSEYLNRVHFSGRFKADFYIAMDSYTRLLLLPYIIRHFDLTMEGEELVESAMDSFSAMVIEELRDEISEYIADIEVGKMERLHNKIVPLPVEEFRKYTMIYFLRDHQEKRYLGRVYLHLAIHKD